MAITLEEAQSIAAGIISRSEEQGAPCRRGGG